VLHNPVLNDEFLIKRIIGLPGERLVIDQQGIRVASTPTGELRALDERAYLSANVVTSAAVDVILGTEEYFVMGDNRPASLDSRSFGPVQRQTIVGRAGVRAWPVHRARTFPTPEIPLLTPTR
jgi:signal peptidase I